MIIGVNGHMVFPPDMPVSGIGLYSFNLLSAMAEQKILEGFTDDFLIFSTGRGRLRWKHMPFTFSLSPLPTWKNIIRIFWEQCILPVHIYKKKFSIFHSLANVIPVMSSYPLHVLTVHDLAFMHYPDMTGHVRDLYLKCLIKQSAIKAHKIIAVSDSTRQDLIKFWDIDPGKIKVIYSGLDERFISIEPSWINDYKIKKGLPETFILFTGDMEKRKNLIMLLQAFLILTRDFKISARLVIAGRRGNDYKNIITFIERENLKKDVIFTGYVPSEELPFLFASATIFAYPSLYEGFGFPLLEAFACRTPVVASSSSSIPEVAGNGAVLLSPFEPVMWAMAFRELISDREKREDLVKRGLERVPLFTWRNTAAETMNVYKEII